ncbi:MAG: hypothetical protein ACR2MG_20995 [Pyrinomonadaceae bacterium]
MQENVPIILQVLNIKIGTLIAGLLGALITMMRKSEGSLQARLVGYFTAFVSVIYVVPFLVWFLEWKFQIGMQSPAENLLSFIAGMTSQRFTENFIDDPAGSVYKWSANLKKFKRVVWNGETIHKTIPPNKILTNDNTSEDKKQ